MAAYIITCNILFFILMNGVVLGQIDSESTRKIHPLIHIYDIADQTQEDITTILGPQSSLNVVDSKAAICANCQKYSYQNDSIIIEYTNDMADRITIRPEMKIEAQHVPLLLGLPDRKPDSISKSTLQWTEYDGIREVNAFIKSDGTVAYILVKVITD